MTSLEENIKTLLLKKEILLVSHAVCGYPSFSIVEKSIDKMISVGVDIIEIQIPFSDPEADGPFFTKANQVALDKGTSVEDCFKFASKICKKYPQANFVFMTYFNILFKYGITNFSKRSTQIGIKGFIIPDLPLEESTEYLKACQQFNLAAIFMVAPNSTKERMLKIAKHASGFIYCQARSGVTGKQTVFNNNVKKYINQCRKVTKLPLAMGFGIKTKQDVDFLKGKVDLAICCTEAVKILVEKGVEEMGVFLQSLR